MSGTIVGVGTDIVEVERIRRAMRNPRFVQRILTAAEIASVGSDPVRVAGRWAAKEAVAKAIGLSAKLRWTEVVVLADASGAPVVTLLRPDLAGLRIHLSISHERSLAVAMAVAVRSLEPA